MTPHPSHEVVTTGDPLTMTREWCLRCHRYDRHLVTPCPEEETTP